MAAVSWTNIFFLMVAILPLLAGRQRVAGNVSARTHPEMTRGLSVALSLPASDETQEIRLIPWEEIWRTLFVTEVRGNPEIIEVFLNSLYEEAVFDDQGAWFRLKKELSAAQIVTTIRA